MSIKFSRIHFIWAFLLFGFFSCSQPSQNDPALKGLEERPFVIINQGFVLDTNNAEESYKILSTIENQSIVDTIYAQLIHKLIEQTRYELALEHLQRYKKSLKPGNFKMQAFVQSHFGEVYYYTAHYDSAAPYLEASCQFYKVLTDSSSLARVYNTLGSVYSFKGDFAKSAEYRYKALGLYEQLGDSSNVNLVKIDLGDNFYDQEDFTKAIECYNTAQRYFLSVGDSVNIAGAHACLASVYQQMKDIPNALYHAKASVAIQRILKDESGLPESLNSLAVTYMRNKEWERAVPFLKEAFYYIEKSNDAKELPPILHNIGVCQSELGHLDSAEATFKKSIDISDKSGQRSGVLNTYKSLYKLSKKKKDFEAAADYLMTIMNLKDSLYDSEKTKIINELSVNYETEKKEEQITDLNQNTKIAEQRKKILIIGITLFSLLAFMVVLYLVSRNRKNKQLFEARSRIHEQELSSVKRELEINKIRLQDFTQNLISKTTLIEELEAKLRAGSYTQSMTDDQFHSYVDEFSKMKLMTETDWNQFRLYFDSVYPGLIQKVTTSFNQITSAELRLFLLIKLSIGNKEISAMLAISPDSVKKTRYRLKKKLNLPEEASLDDFVMTFH